MQIPDGMNIFKDFQFSETAFNIHGHTPSSGGKICWNDLQLVNMYNSIIRQVNKAVHELLAVADGTVDHIPYIASPPNPTQGYNTHHHTSEYDGGLIFGGGLHDHRDMSQAGYAYAVYHPATNLPKLPYEREEVFGAS